MFEEIKKELTPFKPLTVLLTIAAAIYLLQNLWQLLGHFSNIIIILIFSWLLSFILEPLVEKTTKLIRCPKVWATLIIYIILSSIFAFIIITLIPEVVSQIQHFIIIVPKHFKTSPAFINKWISSLIPPINNYLNVVPSVAQFLFSLSFILIFSFYFIIDKQRIRKELYYITPKKWHEHGKFLEKVVNDTFISFLRVQIIFSVLSGILTWIVLAVFGIGFAASTAILAGIFTIVPLFGAVLAVIPPVFVALLISPLKALIILIVLLILQQIMFNVLGPKLLGRAFKIHPLVILLSFLVGFKIAGGVGAIFAIPVLGILVVIIREISHYFVKPNLIDKTS